MKPGETHSAESRAKISAAMKGKPKSEATKEKMAFAATIRWNRERNRKRKLAALMGIGTFAEIEVEPARSVTESFNSDGGPV